MVRCFFLYRDPAHIDAPLDPERWARPEDPGGIQAYSDRTQDPGGFPESGTCYCQRKCPQRHTEQDQADGA